MRWLVLIGGVCGLLLVAVLSLAIFGGQFSERLDASMPLPAESVSESAPNTLSGSEDAPPIGSGGPKQPSAVALEPLAPPPTPSTESETLAAQDDSSALSATDLRRKLQQTSTNQSSKSPTRGLVIANPQQKQKQEQQIGRRDTATSTTPQDSEISLLRPSISNDALLSIARKATTDVEAAAETATAQTETVEIEAEAIVEAPVEVAAASAEAEVAAAEVSDVAEVAAVAAVASAAPAVIIPTHLFAAPGQIPPDGYLAYGVVAFPQNPTPDTEARFAMLCKAFRGNLAGAANVTAALPDAQQVVTIWPISTPEIARQINESPMDEGCELAAKHYNLPHSEFFMDAARAAGENIGADRGPFLLAWRPGHSIGTIGAPVLEQNLSLVVTKMQAEADFRAWKDKIRSACWDCPRYRDEFRRTLRLYSDYHGSRIIGTIRAMFTDLLLGDGESEDA